MALPNPPNLEEKLPFIWRELIDPCDAPITVWLECMWEPLKELIFEWWFQIDLWQILTTFARPNLFYGTTRIGGHGSKNKGKKRTWWKDKFGNIIFGDINEWIGNALPFGEEIREEYVSLGRARLWLIFEVLERAAFWWGVLELSTDFLYRWMSAVAETKYCKARDDAVFLKTGVGQISIGILGWAPTFWGPPDKSRRITFYNGYGVQQFTAPGMVTAVGTWRARNPALHGSIWSRLHCVAGPNAGKTVTIGGATGDTPAGSHSLFADCMMGDTWVHETLADVDIYDWSNMTFLLQASP